MNPQATIVIFTTPDLWLIETLQRTQMHNDTQLENAVETIAERLTCWAEAALDAHIAQGFPLEAHELRWAHGRHVHIPERVRIVITPCIPFPDDALLKSVSNQLGLLDSQVAALTLGYTIFSSTHPSDRVLKHELRHVQQYEALGGVRGFLTRYVGELLAFGYANAPLEVDARNHEVLAGD